MRLARNALLATAVAFASAAPTSSAVRIDDPLEFFAGTTETLTTVKVVMRKTYRARSIGHGKIRSDGSLVLVGFPSWVGNASIGTGHLARVDLPAVREFLDLVLEAVGD
jgi:hypothetical protein